MLTWGPLLLLGADNNMLACSIGWYLTFIAPVRHAKLWFTSGFDPSGHVFVYGAQLIPHAWLPRMSRSLSVWSAAIVFLSGTTGAFFHEPAETFTGWLLVLILYAALHAHVRVTARELVGVGLAWSFPTGIFLVTCSSLNFMRIGEVMYDLALMVLLAHLVKSQGPDETTVPPALRVEEAKAMKVADLKLALTARGLLIEGKKPELLARLLGAL